MAMTATETVTLRSAVFRALHGDKHESGYLPVKPIIEIITYYATFHVLTVANTVRSRKRGVYGRPEHCVFWSPSPLDIENRSKYDLARFAASGGGRAGTEAPPETVDDCASKYEAEGMWYHHNATREGPIMLISDFGMNRIGGLNLKTNDLKLWCESKSSPFGELRPRLDGPACMIHVPSDNSILIAEFGGNRIRRIHPSGAVTIVAGRTGAYNPNGYSDGAGSTAQFNCPSGLAVDSGATFCLVSDRYNNRLRRVELSGAYVVSTVAGDGDEDGNPDGPALSSSLPRPQTIAWDLNPKLPAESAVYVSTLSNGQITRFEILAGALKSILIPEMREVRIRTIFSVAPNRLIACGDASIHVVNTQLWTSAKLDACKRSDASSVCVPNEPTGVAFVPAPTSGERFGVDQCWFVDRGDLSIKLIEGTILNLV